MNTPKAQHQKDLRAPSHTINSCNRGKTMITSNPMNKTMRKLGFILAATLVIGSTSPDVGAQVVVTNPISDTANHADFLAQLGKTAEQYAKQIEQWQTEVSTYQQMLTTVEGLSSGMSLLPNQLQKITDEDTLVQSNCPGPTGGIVGSLMSGLGTLLGQQPITATQQAICTQIVKTQIDKYNITVDLLNQMNTYASKFKEVETAIQNVATIGDANAVSNQAADYHNAVTTQVSNWQAQINADDAMISTLQQQQDLLATRALRGHSTILGTVIQAGTLAAALKVDNPSN